MSGAREREASLAVVSTHPVRVADRIAALRELAGFRLSPLPDRGLRDVYLDRPDGALGEAGLSLRLRSTDGGAPELAVKGDERRLPGGGVDRLEREAPWSDEALAAAAEVLSRAGLSPDLLPRRAGDASAVERLRAGGWHVVQERRTRRRARTLRPGGGAGDAAGELAVDEVRFDPDGGPAIHREVEVEAAPGGDLPPGVVEALLGRFPDDLRPWDPSKLATGRALERLLEGDAPDRWLAPDGSLLPEAYDRIEAATEGG